MARVVIVTAEDLTPHLGNTILWRDDVERIVVHTLEAALEAARRLAPNLVLLDGSFTEDRTAEVVRRLRADGETRTISVAVFNRASPERAEGLLSQAGINLILNMEGSLAFLWDAWLEELLRVPRRRDGRLPVRFAVWSHGTPEEPVEALNLNVSVTGMLLETKAHLAVGQKLDLSLRLPGDGEDVRVTGQVVRDSKGGEGVRRYGVKFIIADEDVRDRIARFVDQGARS